MRNKGYLRPRDRQTVSPRRWDWDKEKGKRNILAVQSGNMAALEE